MFILSFSVCLIIRLQCRQCVGERQRQYVGAGAGLYACGGGVAVGGRRGARQPAAGHPRARRQELAHGLQRLPEVSVYGRLAAHGKRLVTIK